MPGSFSLRQSSPLQFLSSSAVSATVGCHCGRHGTVTCQKAVLDPPACNSLSWESDCGWMVSEVCLSVRTPGRLRFSSVEARENLRFVLLRTVSEEADESIYRLPLLALWEPPGLVLQLLMEDFLPLWTVATGSIASELPEPYFLILFLISDFKPSPDAGSILYCQFKLSYFVQNQFWPNTV